MTEFLNFTDPWEIDEEAAYAVCRMIDIVGHELVEDWDWDWLNEFQGDSRSLLKPSLVNAARSLLAQKDWLSLQTTAEGMRPIVTIAPLKGLANLRSLIIQNNLITDLEPLSGMVKLKYLNCYGNRIVDLAPLTQLEALEELHLGDNPLSSLAVLKKLPNLRKLVISTNQVECLMGCNVLASIQVLEIAGEGSVDDLTRFPEMPALRVLRISRLRDITGVERLSSLGTLKLDGEFSHLNGMESLKGLTHFEARTSNPLSLQPLRGLYALRSLVIAVRNVRDLSALARLPVLHEVRVSNESQCNRIELETLTEALTPWNEEFRSQEKKATPTLCVEIVSQDAFDLYDTKLPFGIRPDECDDGMFRSEREWLLRELSDALKVRFEESKDFVLPGTSGLRRSERLVLYTLRSYEAFREIVTTIQGILSAIRNDWIIYFQSALGEGPDCDDLPEEYADFTVWIYCEKIVTTRDDSDVVRKLVDWC